MQVAYENYTKASSAESRTGRTESQLASEASKIFMETYPDAKEVVNQVFDTWFTFEPKLPSAAENQFLLEAATAFQDGYKIYGTTEGAETYMQTVLTDTWGVTQTRVFRDGNVQFSNSVLVKHPPEKYYKSFDEDYGPLYKAISEHAVAGGAQASNAILLADDITDREVREGKAPTYKVIGMDEFGAAIVLPDRFGGEELYQQTEEKYIYNAMRANAMHGINVFSQAVESATAKLQSLSLSGGTPEEIAAAQDELARAMKGKQVAVETALANEHLDAAMPTSPDDPAFKKLVEVATDAFANDASLQRQSAALASSYKNVDWAEANRRALADIFGKQYKLTPEMAMALTNKVLENY
jgi:DNA-binding phage protein